MCFKQPLALSVSLFSPSSSFSPCFSGQHERLLVVSEFLPNNLATEMQKDPNPFQVCSSPLCCLYANYFLLSTFFRFCDVFAKRSCVSVCFALFCKRHEIEFENVILRMSVVSKEFGNSLVFFCILTILHPLVFLGTRILVP